MPLRNGWRPVMKATRVGVQEGSVYMRDRRIPSRAILLIAGVRYPRMELSVSLPRSPKPMSSIRM